MADSLWKRVKTAALGVEQQSCSQYQDVVRPVAFVSIQYLLESLRYPLEICEVIILSEIELW